MDTNLTANNSPFNIGLDPNLHPLLAPESIFPTTIHPTNLLAPLETQALHFTANSTIYADGGATNLNNLLYTPFSGVVNSNPLLNSFLNSSSLSLSTTPQNSSPPPPVTVAPPQPTHNFAIQAGGIVTFNGKSDLDGNPLDLTDDAFVYAGKGFTLNGNSILPVQRNAAGNALTNSQGKLLLLDQALVVAPGYLQNNSNGNNNYTNLNPPQVIAKQTISIPSFNDVKQQELANRIPLGAVTVTFNTAPSSSQFPSGGNATQPKVIRINNGSLNIPNNVNLSNSIIIVENGDINFNGKGTLTNVVLVANNGNINLNQTETENSSFLAAGRINTNSKASLGGKTLLANGQGDITFNGDMKGTNSLQNLHIVSQGRITFNGKAEVRGDFRSVGTFSSNGKADIYGTVASLGDIVFNGASTFTYSNLGNIQPNSPTLQLAAISDTGVSNSDKITNINTPTINGTGAIGTTIKIKDGNILVGQTTVGSDGKWQLATNSLTNGTHSLIATATDIAGNISTASAPLNLVIDSIAPQLILNSPLSILNSTTKLTGTINGTGTALASINYRWDNSQTLISIAPNATGEFDQQLDYTGIANGTHTIAIVSTDIAGNITTNSYDVTVAIAPADTQAPIITAKLSTDTGISNSDKITFTPTITGTINDASQIAGFKASFDGINYVNILPQKQADGKFTLDKTQLTTVAGKPLVDGNYTLHLIATDEFANASQNYDVSFILDSTINVPTNLKLAIGSDADASNSDNITNINTPTITGTGDVGATIKLTEGTVVVGQVTVGTDGKWQIVTSALSNGSHSLIATATDIAGNISTTSTPLNLVIDALLPQLTLTTPLTQAPLKNDAKLVGNIDGTGSNLVEVNYRWDNSTNSIAIASNPTGGFDQGLDFTDINNGVHTLTITATDIAGNILTSNYDVNIALDKEAPIVNLQLATDTGTNTSDKITNNPTITGKVTDSNGVNAVTVSLNPNLTNSINITTSLQSDGTFSLDKTLLMQLNGGQLPDGNYQVYLQAIDNYGNTTPPQTLAFQLLTQATAPTNLQLLASSDTGVSNSDSITKNNQPEIQGNGKAGDTIQLLEGTTLLGQTTVDTDGKWQITSTALADGTHNLTAQTIDIAGNISANLTSLNIVIDSLDPQLTLTQVLDNATLVNHAKLTGIVNGSGSNLTSVSYQWDSGNQIAINPNVSGNFDQSLDFTGISNGTHNLTITATDIAGNTLTKSYNVNTALDKIAPVITAKLSTDTGISNSDKITFTPTITGTISDASHIAGFTASFDGINYVNIFPQIQADGTFTLDKTQLTTVAGKPLIDGNYTLHLIATDEFGNTSQDYNLAFTLDTTITVPNNLQLAVGSDRGASNSDKITSINTPTISGTGDIGATIKLTDGNVLVGETIVGNDGTWQIVTNPLTNGVHSLTAIAIDLAGNISTASTPFSIIIDALLPQLTLATPLTQTALTNGAKLVGNIDGTGSNLVEVNYRWDNSTTLISLASNPTGGFDQGLDFTGINNGAHTLTITATDIAGNILTSNYDVTVALDKEAPIVNLQLATDTGTNTSDKITNNPTITGKVTDISGISAVTVSLNPNLTNSVNITATLQADGTFTLDKTLLTQLNGGQLPDGNYQVYLIAIDLYGNSTAPQSLTFQLLTQSTIPTNIQLIASSDTGASNSDKITNNNQPTLQGNGKAGDTIQGFFA